MRGVLIGLLAVTWLGLASNGPSFAQGRRSGPSSRLFNPQTVQTVSGTVLSVDDVPRGRGRYAGVHLLLQTDAGTVSVHLGPQWYLASRHVHVSPRDLVEVTGSRVMLHGQSVLIAAQITKDRQTLQLRDARGMPLWRGSGAR